MTCLAMWANAFEFSVMWACQSLIVGYDNSGGAGNAFVTDTTAQWTLSPRVNVGAPIYNSTEGAFGIVTGVAPTVLQTSTATWTNGDEYQIANMTGAERVTIENFLRIAASDINAALRATGACDCSLAADALVYLAKLNIIDAAIWHNCPCGRPDLSEEQRRSFLDWINRELDNLRTGAIDLCSGYTGREWPAIATAEMAWTDWRAAEIMIDTIRRTP